MTVTKGSISEGVVKGITNFGAFVELPNGVTGLVHISEVADAYVKNVSDYLKENDVVKVKVINVGEEGKIGLSIKQANPDYEPRRPRRPQREQRQQRQPQVSFEDKLAKFLKDSDERQADVKRQSEGKRGGRGSRTF